MKQLLLLALVTALCSSIFMGCDRSPKDLGKEYQSGKCAVCARNTKVRAMIINPFTGYSVKLCWRPECEQKFGANRDQYIDKSKLPDPKEFGTPMNIPPRLPGGTTPAPVAPR